MTKDDLQEVAVQMRNLMEIVERILDVSPLAPKISERATYVLRDAEYAIKALEKEAYD